MNFIIASSLLLSLVSFGEPSLPPEFRTPDCSSDSDCTKWAVEMGSVNSSDYCCAHAQGNPNFCFRRSWDTNLDMCLSNSRWSDIHFRFINNITYVCGRTPLQASAGLKRKKSKRMHPRRKHPKRHHPKRQHFDCIMAGINC